MVDQKELQEKVFTYRILQSKLESLSKQREIILNKIIEIENTLESIDEFVNSKDSLLFSLDSEAYVFGKVENKESMIVEVGANIALEKTIEEGKKTLSERKGVLERNLNGIENEIMKVSSLIEQLTPELQRLIEISEDQSENIQAG